MAVLYGTMQNGQLVAVEADAQGRLVATLANDALDGFALGFRNILYNGALSINQRNVTYNAASVGGYWADRWKKTSGGMTQIVEEGNYRPLTPYTLSGNNVVTDTQISPASGDWDISATFGDVIPGNASFIQLEAGNVATQFELRPIGIELGLCERYYQANSGLNYLLEGWAHAASSYTTTALVTSPMRIRPIGSWTTGSVSNCSVYDMRVDTNSFFHFNARAAASGRFYAQLTSYILDAEF